jgi:hypothetical protein
MTYDCNGDLLTVDGPLSGTADTARYRYNSAREVVGVLGPAIVKTTYDNAGQVTLVQTA